MTEHYLDNSSTTKPCNECVEAIQRALTQTWGNPSSLHTLGFSAERELISARRAVADRLFCRPEEITFTGGGTESNNLALFGAAAARKKQGNRIVTTAVEHPSVLNCMKELEKQGFEVLYLRPDAHGAILPEQFSAAVTRETILVSVMAVNNEVGALYPIEAASRAIAAAKSPALLHVDAVQAFGKLPLRPQKLHIDLMSVSAHKIHGPKGVGALYLAKGAHIPSRVFGGGQERGLRPGTEPLPLIAGFGAAARALPKPEAELSHIRALNEHCRAGLAELPGVAVLSPNDALPYIISLSTGGVRAETMLHFLAAKGVFVSSGSACAKGKQSHVLTAMNLPPHTIESALRVSFSRDNTQEDVDAFLAALGEGLRTLARVS